MTRSLLLLVLCLFTGLAPGFSIDPDAPVRTSPVPAPQAAPAGPQDNRITEIQTAGYYELVARAKELGLTVTGGVPELRAKIAEAMGLKLPAEAAAKGTTLTIDSAQQAGLITVDAPGNGKLLRLSGGLQITLVDNEKKVTHVIEAGELWYDEANEEMTARGQVVYTMIRESSREVFRGESLTFRLSDSQGIFYGGASDRARTVGSQTLTFRYQGEAIRRSAEDLVVLETGSITSSLGSDPYYHILAKRIWVLAPGEWGLQDAVLYLGRVPVMYFPFFFQPGDEFFFNPVLSFPVAGDRRGTSLQTTTYFLGKKKKDASPLSFLQMEDSKTQDDDRVIRGLFLVKGKAPVSTVPPSWTFKYMADFYARLGFLTSIDATLPGWIGTKTFNAAGGIGITRTVDTTGSTFNLNPFQPLLDPWAQSQWNGSWLGSTRIPFRWGGHVNTDAGWGSLSLEYYSDPVLFNDMTGNRSENFSVFSLLGLGPTAITNISTAKTSLQWTGGLTLPPATMTAGLLWDSKATTPVGIANDPENTFYLPSQMTLPQVSFNFAGALWPPGAPAPNAVPTGPNAGKETKPKASGLIPPSTGSEEPPETVPVAAPEDGEPAPQVVAPNRMESLANGTDQAQWNSGVNWSLRPTAKTNTLFDEASVTTPSNSSWKALTSQWSGAYDGNLTLTTGRADGFWTTTEGLTMHEQTQNTWYKAPSVSATDAATYDLQDKQQTSGLLSQNLGSTLKPFAGPGAWRESNLQYTLTTSLWQATPDTNQWFDGTTKTVTAHQAGAQAITYLLEGPTTLKAQTGWQSALPPLDPLTVWSGGLDLTLPLGKASTKVLARQSPSTTVYDPWETIVTLGNSPVLSLQEDYLHDLNYARPQSSTTTLTAWGTTVQYLQLRTTPYRYSVVDQGWVVAGNQDFLPQQLLFSYSLNIPGIQWWYYRNSLSSQINFSWPINLQQYSNMPMTLNYSVIYKLARFLDFQVSEGVSNTTAYRYFPFLTDTFGPGVVKPVNPLTDLWDSVSFWDQTALRRTGFKMTTLTVGLIHYLDDWQIKLDYTGSPQLVTTVVPNYWQWNSTLTLLVQWYPVPELKTQMNWDANGILTVAGNQTPATTTTTTSN